MTTIDPKDQAAFDQSAKALSENIPSLMWALYSGFNEQGFDSIQSLDLCKIYLRSMVGGARNA